jgi:hypothetical protein
MFYFLDFCMEKYSLLAKHLCSAEHSLVNAVLRLRTHHVTRHNTPIHNTLLTAPQLGISQKALETLPEVGNVMPKHVGDTTHN